MLRPARALILAGLGCLLLASCAPDPATTDTSSATSVPFHGDGTTCPDTNAQPYQPSPPLTNGAAVGQPITEMPHTHIAPPAKVNFLHDPPTSGCHYSLANAPIPAGAYDQPIAPEYWIHNLEHGYIGVLYNCPQKCPTEFQQLHDWFKALPADPGGKVQYAKVFVMPETTMPVKFAVVSWDWYLGMQTLDMNQIKAFYDNHVNQSPEGAAAG